MLKTRHDESLNFNVSVDRKYYTYLLPSLSLQLLVENVVKHNSLSRQQPITISIRSTDKEYLVVENNLARKKSRIESTGIGLSTIREKYRLLQGDNIQVDEHNNEKFTVTLPLIRP